MSGVLTWERGRRGKWAETQITPPPMSPQSTLPQVATCCSGMQAETVTTSSPWVNLIVRRGLFVVMMDYWMIHYDTIVYC
jgi:hypothetical protein